EPIPRNGYRHPPNWVQRGTRGNNSVFYVSRFDFRGAMAADTAPVTTVALVEDDRDTRARLASSIRAQPSLALVAEYANGAEALAGLDSGAPDVLLVDLGLPDVSGLEVARFVAGRYP